MNLYRAKYASSGNETFTKCCLTKDEHAVKFAYLIKHHTGHEKNRTMYNCSKEK